MLNQELNLNLSIYRSSLKGSIVGYYLKLQRLSIFRVFSMEIISEKLFDLRLTDKKYCNVLSSEKKCYEPKSLF